MAVALSAAVIIGCGNVGRRVAAAWLAQGAPVTALARRPQAAEALRQLGIAPFLGDLDSPPTLSALRLQDVVLFYFAPPARDSEDERRLRRFLAVDRAIPRRLIYISTSGVYGDCGGAWVDEDTPLNPQTPRAKRRADAELALDEFHTRSGAPVTILRVPAIYGPGALPLARLRRRDPVVIPTQAPFTNRIHVEDLVRACIVLAAEERATAIYNVSDGRPLNMTDYFFRVADYFGVPRPPVITLEEARERLSAEQLSFWTESRRLNNNRLLQRLPDGLLYPDLESGLAACRERDLQT